ncbi:MAG: DUF1579 family protein [Phycisphaeraceae bacterium]
MKTQLSVLTALLVLIGCTGIAFAADDAAQDPAAPAEPREDKLAMMRVHLGKWTATVKGKATDLIPEPYEVTDRWETREVLGGRMIEVRGESNMNGEDTQYIWLFTYDERESRYVGWYHESSGINAKMVGEWSDKDKTMTWTLADPEAWGMQVTIVDNLSDKSKIDYTFKIVLEDGTLVMDQVGSAKRVEE